MTALAAPCLFFLVALLSAHPKAAVLMAVLYLPLPKPLGDYHYLREWVELKYPGRTTALVNENEEMMMKTAEWTPLYIDDLKLYLIPQQRNMRLVRRSA